MQINLILQKLEKMSTKTSYVTAAVCNQMPDCGRHYSPVPRKVSTVRHAFGICHVRFQVISIPREFECLELSTKNDRNKLVIYEKSLQ